MKIYHVETQEAYDELMSELEVKGYKWLSGRRQTSKDYWKSYKENTCIVISGKDITFMNIEQSKNKYPNIHIIKYKTKGENMTQENMTQEEMKQNILDWAKGVFVEVGAFARDMPEVESDLQEAKSSAKKLIEKIDEYLEYQKPEFKVGDYVTVDVNGRTIIAKIDALRENKKEAHGLWYDKTKVNVKQDYWFVSRKNKVRHATPTEITEYEVALHFYKHGRKPFEVKEGDILRYDESNDLFVDDPSVFKKEHFTSGHYTFIKTAEEVNEWLDDK